MQYQIIYLVGQERKAHPTQGTQKALLPLLLLTRVGGNQAWLEPIKI